MTASGPAATSPRMVLIQAMKPLLRVMALPLLAVLLVLEPLVRFFLAGFALLFIFITAFWALAAPPALHVPLWGLLGISVGCIALLALYEWTCRALSV
jgi:hypothetical protein